jgi:hypothetical protein
MRAYKGTLRRTVTYDCYVLATDERDAQRRVLDVAGLADPATADEFVDGVVRCDFDVAGDGEDALLALAPAPPTSDPFEQHE